MVKGNANRAITCNDQDESFKYNRDSTFAEKELAKQSGLVCRGTFNRMASALPCTLHVCTTAAQS